MNKRNEKFFKHKSEDVERENRKNFIFIFLLGDERIKEAQLTLYFVHKIQHFTLLSQFATLKYVKCLLFAG